jgi:hypothetical protein
MKHGSAFIRFDTHIICFLPCVLSGQLRLTNNRLAGELPSEINALSQLRVFRIDVNDLSGTVPDALCTIFDQTSPVAYADCGEIACPCCSHCCTDGQDCVCIVEDTIRCEGS